MIKLKKFTTLFALLLSSLLFWACSGADCSLNNTVLCYVTFFNGDGKQVSITDTLSILAHGTDSVLFNRGVNKSILSIPLSYYADEDTLIFRVCGKDYQTEAEISINKTNTAYFESTECPAKMFHTIKYAYVQSGSFIDSVVVVKPSINFQRDENIRIYLH